MFHCEENAILRWRMMIAPRPALIRVKGAIWSTYKWILYHSIFPSLFSSRHDSVENIWQFWKCKFLGNLRGLSPSEKGITGKNFDHQKVLPEKNWTIIYIITRKKIYHQICLQENNLALFFHYRKILPFFLVIKTTAKFFSGNQIWWSIFFR